MQWVHFKCMVLRTEENWGMEAPFFLRWKLQDGSHQCILVNVKPFVAPLKRKTIL